ncbi:hypothetical protein tb265_45360 [Gemmatimonadetes bacterium T265]|nr:hypothetical protein tb265_45360 [Gemmatimonadetes bacterium T265]
MNGSADTRSPDGWFEALHAGHHLPGRAADALHEAGFVVLPGPLAPEGLPPLSAAYDAVMAAGEGSADFKAGGTTARLYDLVNRGAAFDTLYVYPPLLAAAAHVIGRPFRLSATLARTLRPGAAAQALHADLGRDDPARPMAGFIYMVDAFRPDTGATRFVPGSHRWPHLPEDDVIPDRLAAYPGEVLACGPAGSLVVFDASAWHGHTANPSGAPRRSVQGYFVARDVPSGFDLGARMRPETVARLGPLARHVLAL